MGPPIPGRIPWATIQGWAAHHGYDPDTTATLDQAIQAMDRVFLDHHAEQQG